MRSSEEELARNSSMLPFCVCYDDHLDSSLKISFNHVNFSCRPRDTAANQAAYLPELLCIQEGWLPSGLRRVQRQRARCKLCSLVTEHSTPINKP